MGPAWVCGPQAGSPGPNNQQQLEKTYLELPDQESKAIIVCVQRTLMESVDTTQGHRVVSEEMGILRVAQKERPGIKSTVTDKGVLYCSLASCRVTW